MKLSILALTSLIALTACASTPSGYDGRALWDGQVTVPAKINRDVAAAIGKPVLPPAKLILSPSVEGYAKTATRNGETRIVHRKDMRMYHLFHETVHYYQREYNLPGVKGCKAPMEVDAMLLTWEWCKTNNCPKDDPAKAYEISGCK